MKEWLEKFKDIMLDTFGERVVFIGIRGSYGRDEATARSKFDVVVILDNFEYQDLITYKDAISNIEEKDKIYDFITGRQELANWNPSDLFRFYYDTKALYGDLSWLSGRIRKDDAWRSCRSDVCHIYNICVYNTIHDKNADVLRKLYKIATFAMQAKYFYNKGKYIRRIHELAEYLTGADKAIIESYFEDKFEENFESDSEQIMLWASDIIKGKME